MSGRHLQIYAAVVSVALVALIVWVAHHVVRERQSREAWSAQLRREREARAYDLHKLDRANAEAARLATALAETRSVALVTPDGSSSAFEDALGSWIDQINRLNAFLGQHPELGIPELRYLTANDWLDVTKGQDLVSEADYRMALADLRMAAKKTVAPKLVGALQRYLAANHGALPPDAQALAADLPDGLDPAILQRYSINPSGEVKGLRGDQRFVLVETKPVDQLWDSTYFFAGTGAYGLRAPNKAAERTVAAAIGRSQQRSGLPPTEVNQIAPDLQGSIDPATLAAIFNALTTKPNLPSGSGGKP